MAIFQHFKKLLVWLAAFLTACIILNILLSFYYVLPNKYSVSGRASQTQWRENSRVVLRVEGNGVNRTDEYGYNNLPGKLPADELLLVLGSSHSQAFNVNQSESYCSLLQEMLDKTGSGLTVYNSAMDDHTLLMIVQCFKSAMKIYNPSHVVIEIPTTDFKAEDLRAAVSSAEEYKEAEARSEDIKSWTKNKLITLPLLRLSYRQAMHYMSTFYGSLSNAFIGESIDDKPIENDAEDITDALSEVVAYLKSCTDADITILYHPIISVGKNTHVALHTNTLPAFLKVCSDFDVDFINMGDVFYENYLENHTLPHGFVNTSVGRGHLNKTGHKLIADKLFEHFGKEVAAQ